MNGGLIECEFCHVIINDFGHAPNCGDIARAEARRLRVYERDAILAEIGVTPEATLLDFDADLLKRGSKR